MVGKDRHPSLDDKPEMHYTNAVLLESFRITSFLPVAVPHSALADVKVKNYVIPKGAIVLPSLYHVMHNSDHFNEPEVFNPNRFLNDQGIINLNLSKVHLAAFQTKITIL